MLDRALTHVAVDNPPLASRALALILQRLEEQGRLLDAPCAHEPASPEEAGSGTETVSEALAAHIRRRSEFRDYASQLLPQQLFWLPDLLGSIANSVPAESVDTVLEWLERVLPDLTYDTDDSGWLSNEVFSFPTSGTMISRGQDLIAGFQKALSNLAQDNPERFLSVAGRMAASRHLIPHEVLE